MSVVLGIRRVTDSSGPRWPARFNGWLAIVGAVVASVSVGTLAAASPVAAALAVGVALWLAAALFAPQGLLVATVGSLAISPYYFAPPGFTVFGFELSTLHNLLVLAAIGANFARVGFRRSANPVVTAYLIMLASSFVLSARLPGLSAFQSVKSWLALILGPLLLQLPLERRARRSLGRCLMWLASASVFLGVLLHLAGARPLAFTEWWTGVTRLQGASIAPHLADLALVGLMASAVAALSRSSAIVAVLANFTIIVATGTRGATVAGVIVVLGLVFASVGHWHQSRRALTAAVLVVAGVGLAGVLARGALVARSTAFNSLDLSATAETGGAAAWLESPGFNTSGRLGAWVFFWQVAEENLVFGRGMGAATVANQGQLHAAFRVPHNEYLRLVVDAGLFGLVIALAAYVLVFRRVLRACSQGRSGRVVLLAAMLAFAAEAAVGNPLATPQFSVPFWLLLANVEQGGVATTGSALSGGVQPTDERRDAAP